MALLNASTNLTDDRPTIVRELHHIFSFLIFSFCWKCNFEYFQLHTTCCVGYFFSNSLCKLICFISLCPSFQPPTIFTPPPPPLTFVFLAESRQHTPEAPPSTADDSQQVSSFPSILPYLHLHLLRNSFLSPSTLEHNRQIITTFPFFRFNDI